MFCKSSKGRWSVSHLTKIEREWEERLLPYYYCFVDKMYDNLRLWRFFFFFFLAFLGAGVGVGVLGRGIEMTLFVGKCFEGRVG